MTQLFIQTQDPSESPYPYYIPVPDVGNMYFNSKQEAHNFIQFYHEYMDKKKPKSVDES